MEGSMKEQKIRAMKSYRRAKFVYNFVLYSLTSLITCFFFSYPFWSTFITPFLASLPSNIPYFLNAKCLFLVGNLIVVVLIGESRLREPSSSPSDVYDEYLARSRSRNPNMEMDESKVEVRRSSILPHDQEKGRGIRSCRSEVWGGSERRREKSRVKKEDELSKDVKVGMRSCKSEVWGEGSCKVQKNEEKGNKNEEKKAGMKSCKSEIWGEESHYKVQKKEEKGNKNEEKKAGMRSCKSEVWGEESHKVQKKEEIKTEEQKPGMRSCRSAIWAVNDIAKTEETKGKMEEEKKAKDDQQKKVVMRSSRSAIWGESDRKKEETNQIGMKSSKSAVWGESVGRSEEERAGTVTPEDLNTRVEAFIARVNKQRLLEANLGSDHSIG